MIQNSDNSIRGISIEPIKYYLDRLPNRDLCLKINCAVSNYEGTIDVHYVSDDDIKKYDLPWYVRGCNSVNKHHPSIVKLLLSRELVPDDIFTVSTVPVRTIKSIIEEYDIISVKTLKIDTEGHDCVILNSYLDYCDTNNNLLPLNILFESNILSNREDISDIIERCKNLGYNLLFKEEDTLLSKAPFTNCIDRVYLSGYLDGFNPNLLPYENTLEGAKKWCIENKGGGVTFQYGRYEVRDGKELVIDILHPKIKSWLYLGR